MYEYEMLRTLHIYRNSTQTILSQLNPKPIWTTVMYDIKSLCINEDRNYFRNKGKGGSIQEPICCIQEGMCEHMSSY